MTHIFITKSSLYRTLSLLTLLFVLVGATALPVLASDPPDNEWKTGKMPGTYVPEGTPKPGTNVPKEFLPPDIDSAVWGLVEVPGSDHPYPVPKLPHPNLKDISKTETRVTEHKHAFIVTTDSDYNGIQALDVHPNDLWNDDPFTETVVLPVWLHNATDWAEVGVRDYGEYDARIYTYDDDQQSPWQYHNWIDRDEHYELIIWVSEATDTYYIYFAEVGDSWELLRSGDIATHDNYAQIGLEHIDPSPPLTEHEWSYFDSNKLYDGGTPQWWTDAPDDWDDSPLEEDHWWDSPCYRLRVRSDY